MLVFLAFVLGCSLPAVHAAGKGPGPGPQPCVFPFVFGKRSYTACTKDGAIDGRQWCATTANYDKDASWRPCFIHEYGGNSGGKPCVFPFTYKNRTFYTCTDEERGLFWCATVQNYDRNPQWSFCADTKLDAEPKGPCVFPFIYNHTIYSSCTTDGISNKRSWCSLTNNYDVDLKWAYCEPSGPHEFVESAPCFFPFIYKGKSYRRCTTDGRTDGKFWCATTSNYDADMKITFCQDSELKRIPAVVVQQTVAPTSFLSSPSPAPSVESPSCVFPFIYMGELYRTCTKEGMTDGRLWCAATSNYDMDKKWMYCNVTEQGIGQEKVPEVHCVFPFMYNRKLYLSCTTDGMAGKRPWCSLTVNYNSDFQWAYCEPSGLEDIMESSPCIFPFIYKGKSYRSCTADGQSDGKLWCATTSNYDADKKSKFCEDTGSERTPPPTLVEPQTTAPPTFPSLDQKVENPSCTFPFTYKGKLYTTCTNEGMSNGKFWCATNSNYDEVKEWMFCNVTGPDSSAESPSCVFPFIFKGKSYSTCTTDGMNDGKCWCATTSNYDVDKKWMYCNITGPDESMESPPCVFPFIYKGRFYGSCTTDGLSDGKFWCSTTSNYDANKKWKFCEVSGPDPNVKGPSCIFPFIYNGKSYSTCTSEGMSNGKLWCATSSNYDVDKKWIYCSDTDPRQGQKPQQELEQGPSQEMAPCVFPFTCNGKTYNSCTADGRRDGKLWCATTRNFETEKKWRFCTVTSTGCVFPFIYKGKSYERCSTVGQLEGKAWCSTTPDYHTGQKWRLCNETDCVFPFIFRGKLYHSCTQEGRADNKHWCSLSGNADADRSWLQC